MKSLTGNSPSARGWALLLILFLGAGLFVAACGEEETPAPTTPPPAPPPTPTPPPPEPEPEAPAVPTNLHVDERTANSITWHWNAVEGAVGYVVQASMDETWEASDTVTFNGAPFTTETEYTATGLEPETTVYVRVASAAGTVAAPVVSDFSTHVTGMTTADTPPGPPVPANLRVTGQTANSITWEWNAVEGATGYQSQFSGTSTFPTGSTGREFSTNTTRTVSNLDAEADGYLRVRAYTGTQAEPVFGMWTEGEMGTTAEPPPAAPLSAPDGLDTDGRDDDSITLTWDRVRNAGSYEVEQRVPPGGDWGDADCGGDGNEVEDEECVASGLAAGTDYDFRVRAVPSDTDRYETSGWSDTLEARTSGTPPVQPTAPVAGGMGNLNVRWQSDADTITWIWDRVSGQTYDYVISIDEAVNSKENPCTAHFEGTLTESDSVATAYTTASGDVTRAPENNGGVALFCVRTSDKNNVSFAWGVLAPTAPTATQSTGATLHGTRENLVTALTWTAHDLVGGYNWETRLVADTQRRPPGPAHDVTVPTVRTGSAMQKACEVGNLVDADETDVRFTLDEVSVRSGLTPYRGYILCSRFHNASGTSDWIVPVTKLFTHPGSPPTPQIDSARSTNTSFTWTVGVRNTDIVPREDDGYNAKIVTYDVTFVDTGNNDRRTSTTTPQASDCEAGSTTPGQGHLALGRHPAREYHHGQSRHCCQDRGGHN